MENFKNYDHFKEVLDRHLMFSDVSDVNRESAVMMLDKFMANVLELVIDGEDNLKKLNEFICN